MKANLLPALAVWAVGIFLFRQVYLRRKSALARGILILTGAILAAPAAFFASNYLLLIPRAEWFVELHSLPGAEVTSGLVGALLGVMFASSKLRPGRLNAPILVVCTIGTAGLAITPFAKQVFYGVAYSDLRDQWKDGVCLQTSSYTCMPASFATVMRLQGGNATERELARDAGTTRRGTEVWYLLRALRRRGYEPRFHMMRSIRQAPVPCIVGVKLGSIGHAVVLLDKSSNGVTVGEPLGGRREYDWQTFMRQYHPEGTCVTVRRQVLCGLPDHSHIPRPATIYHFPQLPTGALQDVSHLVR